MKVKIFIRLHLLQSRTVLWVHVQDLNPRICNEIYQTADWGTLVLLDGMCLAYYHDGLLALHDESSVLHHYALYHVPLTDQTLPLVLITKTDNYNKNLFTFSVFKTAELLNAVVKHYV
jgi:hypothetical protein